MTTAAAIGFRAHSGWAAAVAVTGTREAPVAVMRRRIEMGESQPYHAAVNPEIAEAGQLVTDCAGRAASLAEAALRAMIDDLCVLGHEVCGCGLLLASGRPLPALEDILRSHALIHTAEGELFRDALRAAVRQCGLPLVAAKEREVFARASDSLAIAAERIERHVAAMGKAMGPPWRQDEKLAAAAGWLALCGG